MKSVRPPGFIQLFMSKQIHEKLLACKYQDKMRRKGIKEHIREEVWTD
jgi:hypothetical protein